MIVIGSLSGGGAERVVSVLANNFTSLGHEVYLVTVAKDKIDYYIDDGIIYHHVNSNFSLKGLSGLNRIFNLRKYIKQQNSDIVISFTAKVNIYVLLAKLTSKFKVIVSERNSPDKNPQTKFIRFIRTLLYFNSDGFVFQTEGAKNYFPKFIRRKSEIISNPLSPNLPMKNSVKRVNKIVAVGRLEEQKNYPLLIKAFNFFLQECPDYELHIYGDGSLQTDLECKINELDLEMRVLLKGNVKEWHREAIDAKMYVLTSDYEGLPNSLMESMAMGIPSISSDCTNGGPKELISHGENGFLFPVGDCHSLANYMLELANNPNLAKKFSENSIESSKEYDQFKITSKWLSYINKGLPF